MSFRLPPHSVEAEQSLLGALLLDNQAFDRVADLVTAEDFYRDDHRRIFRHVSRLIEQNRPADVVTLAESIDASEDKDKTGGAAYLAALSQTTPTALNIRRYAEIVRERSVQRRLAQVATDIAETALAPSGKEVGQLLDEAESRIFQIAESGARRDQGLLDIKPVLARVFERIDHLHSRDNVSDVTGVPTGFVDLDRKTAGLQPGDLVIIAARPSMGKAQPLDAGILTEKGWKRMGALRLGDRLASPDGAPSRVSGIFPQGIRQAYRVTFSDGRSTECCAEHLWQVMYREWDAPRVLTTAQLREKLANVRYRNRIWMEPISGDFGHRDALPLDPYVLGVLLGDGNFTGSTIRLSSADGDLLEAFSQHLGEAHVLAAAGGYDYRVVTRGGHRRTGVQGVVPNAIKEALRGLALLGLRSEKKFIPATYLSATRQTRLELLRGLLDTDGWVESFGAVRFCTPSEQLAKDVVTLARSLGATASFFQKLPRCSYRGETRSGLAALVCNIQHSDPASLFRLERKRRRVAAGRKRLRRLTIDSIEPTRMTEMQCISVTHPGRLYVTDEFIVTHNTALALNIAEHVAVDNGLPVAIFSMEMSAVQLAMRMLSSMARVEQGKLRTGRLNDAEWSQLTEAIGRLHETPIYIDEGGALTALEVRARARRLKRQYSKLGLIVIDYIQLMAASTQGENRATEISEISRSLKAMSKELDVPVIALSQLNRAVDQRPDRRPVMSDLRESGAIEQDADVIMFIYREVVYKPDLPDEQRGTAEVILGKQRNGPIGTVKLTFRGQFTRFENFQDPGSY
ncbi:MAG: replicative DNA helicase [Betaproteobacteria bacterium]